MQNVEQKLKLKKEYEGLVMTKKCHNLGDVTFNAISTPENLYNNYFRLEAFTHMFVYVDVCEKCKQEECICKKGKKCFHCGNLLEECTCTDSIDEVEAELKKYTGVTQKKKK